eukprot:3766121-Heterocapsa_arctica.AAC.1
MPESLIFALRRVRCTGTGPEPSGTIFITAGSHLPDAAGRASSRPARKRPTSAGTSPDGCVVTGEAVEDYLQRT